MTWDARIRLEFARRGKHADDTVVEEMAQHAAAAYESARADGAVREEAAAHVQSLIESWCAGTTGPRRLVRVRRADALNASRDTSPAPFRGFFQDVMFGARMITRSPGVSLVVLLTIAFGAGLNGAVFVQFNDAFLRPPDLTRAETLVWFDDGGARTGSVTYPDYADYRDRVAAIDLALFGRSGKTTTLSASEARQVSVALASGTTVVLRLLSASSAMVRTPICVTSTNPSCTVRVERERSSSARRVRHRPSRVPQPPP